MLTCDRLELTILVDNFIDMLIPNSEKVARQGMPEHFAPVRGTPLAENGISFLVKTTTAGRTTTILFDAGMTGETLVHNAKVLDIDLSSVDQVVLSHGHPDHFGGIYGALQAIGGQPAVVVHPDAFAPRSIQRADTTLLYFNRALTEERLRDAGAALFPVRGPIDLSPGVATSGEIPTVVDFEQEVPTGRVTLRDGLAVADNIDDYLCLIINVRGKGLVVLDPCGHAGVVSAVRRSIEVAGTSQIEAVMGGFHLGHEGISQEKIEHTAEALADLSPSTVSPMHCSGLRAVRAIAEHLPDAFVQMTVGARLVVEGSAK